MKEVPCSDNKKEHSKKKCCCGGHSQNDNKSDTSHHGTKAKLNIRKLKQFKKKRRCKERESEKLSARLGD